MTPSERRPGSAKNLQEIRDPIHNFIYVAPDEMRVVDSRPLQRLRHIHQLALTYLVYPGATHKRFEHSLGVMELAGRVFEVVTRNENIREEVRELLPEIREPDKLVYWKRVLRMAALCHDVGHLPFSHAGERDLLPEGWDHERLTKEILLSQEMNELWNDIRPHLHPNDVTKLALGPKKAKDLTFSPWETILSEIIVGDAFGVDRIDYLLRDSYHAGVAYGRFDHYRLVDTLRILPRPGTDDEEVTLGIEEGGLHSTEALLLARYFMYSQVYYHRVRVIYDDHLKEFLSKWMSSGRFSIAVDDHLRITDNEVLAALREATRNASLPGHEEARRIISREHFKELYHADADVAESQKFREPGETIFNAAKQEFGDEHVRHIKLAEKGHSFDFPVELSDGSVKSSSLISDALGQIPLARLDMVYISPEKRTDAFKWLKSASDEILKKAKVEDE